MTKVAREASHIPGLSGWGRGFALWFVGLGLGLWAFVDGIGAFEPGVGYPARVWAVLAISVAAVWFGTR